MTPTPVLYAMRPAGPEITRRALLRRLRERGIGIVSLPAGHYILGEQRATVDRIVGEINANLRHLAADVDNSLADRLDVLYRPIPAPTEGEGA